MPTNRSTMTGSVELVYAQALLDLAVEDKQLAQVSEQLVALDQVISDKPELLGLFDTPVISLSQRRQCVERIFKEHVSDLLYRFLQVLNSKGRLGLLARIIHAYSHLLDQRDGVVEVEVFVAIALQEQQTQRISQEIGKAIGRNVVIHQHVDPTLIGGLTVLIGDRLINGSIATQLEMMRQQIVEAGRDQARAGVADLITD